MSTTNKIRLNIREMFPAATEEQIQALDKGLPVPPSPAWLEANPGTPGTAGATAEAQPAPKQAPKPPGPGKVSCVMVVNNVARMKLARRAVNEFVAQTYSNKELVIVNATPTPVTNRPHASIREIAYADRFNPSVGEMRNCGLLNSYGAWVKPWDDDDFYHPYLLSVMMGAREEGKALALSTQVRVRLVLGDERPTVTAFRTTTELGMAGSILYPRLEGLAYPDQDLHEDKEFRLSHFGTRTKVLDNRDPLGSVLHIAVHHGFNLTPVADFMGEYAGPEYAERIVFDFDSYTTSYVFARLRQAGVPLEVVGPAEAASAGTGVAP